MNEYAARVAITLYKTIRVSARNIDDAWDEVESEIILEEDLGNYQIFEVECVSVDEGEDYGCQTYHELKEDKILEE